MESHELLEQRVERDSGLRGIDPEIEDLRQADAVAVGVSLDEAERAELRDRLRGLRLPSDPLPQVGGADQNRVLLLAVGDLALDPENLLETPPGAPRAQQITDPRQRESPRLQAIDEA